MNAPSGAIHNQANLNAETFSSSQPVHSTEFSFGADWVRFFAVPGDPDPGAGQLALEHLSREAVRRSSAFFDYQTPRDFHLERGEHLENGALTFSSAADSPIAPNQSVRCFWYPAQGSNRRAVVILPHWGAPPNAYRSLCRVIRGTGISVLELTLPYHGSRCPKGSANGEHTISANIGRTIHAARQSVIDTRCCLDWLQNQGYERLGMVGTSLGSGFGFLASAHDERLRVNVYNHAGSAISDIVWHAPQARQIRDKMEESRIDLKSLNRLWMCIDPRSYFSKFGAMNKTAMIVYGLFDPVFRVGVSLDTIRGLRAHGCRCRAVAMPCGHASLGWPPFSYIDAGLICAFLRRNL